jgi:hypothetical protein
MKFPFKFIVIGKLNIWQLVQLLGFTKYFKGLLHFCDCYFSSGNINVTAWCWLYYSEFPAKLLPIQKWISLKVACLTLPRSTGFNSAFHRITPQLGPFWILKNQCSFLLLLSYIYIHIYVVYKYIYIYVHYSKFHREA